MTKLLIADLLFCFDEIKIIYKDIQYRDYISEGILLSACGHLILYIYFS